MFVSQMRNDDSNDSNLINEHETLLLIFLVFTINLHIICPKIDVKRLQNYL